jgi:hypothetical protein
MGSYGYSIFGADSVFGLDAQFCKQLALLRRKKRIVEFSDIQRDLITCLFYVDIDGKHDAYNLPPVQNPYKSNR